MGARQGGQQSSTYWLLAGCGFLILSLLIFVFANGPATAPTAAHGRGSSTDTATPGATPGQDSFAAENRPGNPTGLDHPYVFLWIWEDN